MSVLSTSSNYGGRVADNQQGIKQFYTSDTNTVHWIYKTLISKLVVITPQNSKKTVYIDNDLIVNRNLYVNGSIYNPSDERLKENIKEIDSEQYEKLFCLNPIHFSYKTDKKTTHYGMLAQDVEKVFPDLVSTTENNYKNVNYQELLPIMLAKMKHMQSEIDELKQQAQK